MSKENYLKDLFIDEAKPALQRHSGGGGGSGSGDLIECESLPTEGVQADKIYRARWSETVEVPPSITICLTWADGETLEVLSFEEMMGTEIELVTVNSVEEIPIEIDGVSSFLYLCNADGTIYLTQTVRMSDMLEMSSDANVGFISSPDELDVTKEQIGIIKGNPELVTNHYEQIGIPEVSDAAELRFYEDGVWQARGFIKDLLELTSPPVVFKGISEWTSLNGIITYYDTSNVTSMSHMFSGCSKLTEVPLFDTKNVTSMSHMFDNCRSLTKVPLFDTSNVTSMDNMFYYCEKLTEVPLFDTKNVTSMVSMFDGCSKLTEVPLFDTKNVTGMYNMFAYCLSLTEVPLFDTSNAMLMHYMFRSCSKLTKVPSFDTRNVRDMDYMFDSCRSLTECWLRNIKTTLKVGAGTSYGHLLTVDSLVHLIYELRDTGSSKTLTVGSANIEKLASVYVKTVSVTDEMRAEDDLVDEKLPFVVCESTDEGAVLITDYANFKNWQIA